jgi:hypothetical protein
MANPQMPQMPGAAVVTDTLDFVKNLWGSMSVPGMGVPGITAPTMSVEELDKKINDLKAVEAWLNLNTSMLRGSIQALEAARHHRHPEIDGASLAAAITQPVPARNPCLNPCPMRPRFSSSRQRPRRKPSLLLHLHRHPRRNRPRRRPTTPAAMRQPSWPIQAPGGICYKISSSRPCRRRCRPTRPVRRRPASAPAARPGQRQANPPSRRKPAARQRKRQGPAAQGAGKARGARQGASA